MPRSALFSVTDSATATAKSELKYVCVPAHQKDSLLAQAPSWLKILLKDLSSNIRRLNERYVDVCSDLKLAKKQLSVKEKKIEEMTKKLE